MCICMCISTLHCVSQVTKTSPVALAYACVSLKRVYSDSSHMTITMYVALTLKWRSHVTNTCFCIIISGLCLTKTWLNAWIMHVYVCIPLNIKKPCHKSLTLVFVSLSQDYASPKFCDVAQCMDNSCVCICKPEL